MSRELRLIQPRICPARSKQRGVGPLLHDLPGLNNQDEVGVADVGGTYALPADMRS
jgi:hypothetical protein